MKHIKIWLSTHIKPMVFGIIAIVILGESTHMVLHTTKKPANNHTDALLNHLTTIQNRLSTIEQVVSHSNGPNLEPIKQQLNLLSNRINQLQTINPEQLNQTEHILQEQLNTIQTVVNHLDKTTTPIKYLNAQELPFHILSLDSIQHTPVASIDYDFKTIPIEKEDSIASWKLIRIDYAKQQLEFENANKERVLITRDHIG